jgi:hypothetical protein
MGFLEYLLYRFSDDVLLRRLDAWLKEGFKLA